MGKQVAPRIEVLSITDNIKESWLTSKPNIHYPDDESWMIELNKLMQNNLPVAGFKVYCLKFYTSIYFRDLLFCVPNIVPWCTSTRNLEMTSEDYQISIEQTTLVDRSFAQLERCRERSLAGEALDVIKLDLPRSTMMYYTAFIDRRTLVTFIKTLETLSGHLFQIYGKRLLEVLDLSIDDFNKTKVHDIYDKLSYTSAMLPTVNTSKASSDVINIMDAYVMHQVTINFGIAAQFIRQHFSLRKYHEFNVIRSYGYQYGLTRDTGTLRDRTSVAVLGDSQSFNRTISRRLCFFAAWDVVSDEVDSWGNILDSHVEFMTDEQFKQSLPCKGCAGSCDIKDEFKLRALKSGDATLKDGVTSADRNEICPILLEELLPDKTASAVMQDRKLSQGSNSKVFDKWNSVYGGKLVTQVDRILNIISKGFKAS